jgi:hypothetical protein
MLNQLPVELLYEIQLYALSHSLPLTSSYLHQIFKSAPPSFHAEYIFLRVSRLKSGSFYSYALRYRVCSLQVLHFIQNYAPTGESRRVDLPKHLFSGLIPRKDSNKSSWNESDHPLSFLRSLRDMGFIVNFNSDSGYGLVKAVQSGFIPLVRYLLDQGALPSHKGDLAVRVAIRQNNLQMVKLLIERSDKHLEVNASGANEKSSCGSKAKRRKLEDRVRVSKDMLKMAVKCNAQDIVDYFIQEKGCVPDMQTLYLMR